MCSGAPDRIRTCDLRLRRPTLYPLSYRRAVSNDTRRTWMNLQLLVCVPSWVMLPSIAAPPDIAFDALQHAFTNEGPVMAALPSLHVPVVAINPDYRPTDEASLQEYGVETVVASGIGHFLMLEDPAQFNRLLGGILARIPYG